MIFHINQIFQIHRYGKINPYLSTEAEDIIQSQLELLTFDGLNSFGRPYNINLTGTDSESFDTLTSRIIDLSGLDSLFLCFYQSQGLGNDPQVTDSLILEFSAEIDSFGNNVWNTIWKSPQKVLFMILKNLYLFSDTNYLNNKFQFRFRNLTLLLETLITGILIM